MPRTDQRAEPGSFQRAKAVVADPPTLSALRRFRAIGPEALLRPFVMFGTMVQSVRFRFLPDIWLVAFAIAQCLLIAQWSWEAWGRTRAPQVHVHLARIDAWSRISDRRYLTYAVAAGTLAIAVFVQAMRVGQN